MQDLYVNLEKGKRQNVQLTVKRVEASVWDSLGFAQHHYLTSELNPACRCLLFFWNDQPVAFVAVRNLPLGCNPCAMAISRIVVHPDYQGLGLARPLMDFVGSIVQSLGDTYVLYIKTIHSKMGAMLGKNKNWAPTTSNQKQTSEADGGGQIKHFSRPSFCYKYVGTALEGYQDILAPIEALRYRKELLLMGPSLFGDDDW